MPPWLTGSCPVILQGVEGTADGPHLYRGDAVLMEQPGELTCGGARGDHIIKQGHMPVVVGRHLEGAAQIASPLARH